jgi:hypothetical protein
VLYFWLIPVMIVAIFLVAALYRAIGKNNPGERKKGRTVLNK